MEELMAIKYINLMSSLVLAVFVAGLPVTAVAKKNGAVPLGAGGGAVRDALFNSGEGDATFSFHAGYDRHGEPAGAFMLKRVYPGKGVTAVVSKEVTDVEVGFDVCPYVKMAGRTALHAWWVDYPQERREYFFLQAWDCAGIDHHDDKVWFGVYRELDPLDDRPQLTLDSLSPYSGDYFPVELTRGNINIPY
jgi:hypothetical protein